ncbi:MAG: hypothetical protein R3C70_04540 [Geminicoccaceae bacterium]
MSADPDYYPIYVEHRKKLQELAADQSRSLDKAVVTISSGALGVSVAFGDKILWNKNVIDSLFLAYSWSFFTASILFTSFSFWTSSMSIQRQIALFDKFYQENLDVEETEKLWSRFTKWLGVIAVLFMTLGIAFMGTFVFKNFPTENQSVEQFKGIERDETKAFDKRSHDTNSAITPSKPAEAGGTGHTIKPPTTPIAREGRKIGSVP